MKRRSAFKSSLVISAWTTPIISVVTLPAHAMTSAVIYAGIVNVVSSFTILSEWRVNVVQLGSSRFTVVLQNTDNTVHIEGEIDQIGPFNALGVTGSCTEIEPVAAASISSFSSSSISLNIELTVSGGSEAFALAVPVAISGLAIPPLSSSCTLT